MMRKLTGAGEYCHKIAMRLNEHSNRSRAFANTFLSMPRPNPASGHFFLSISSDKTKHMKRRRQCRHLSSDSYPASPYRDGQLVTFMRNQKLYISTQTTLQALFLSNAQKPISAPLMQHMLTRFCVSTAKNHVFRFLTQKGSKGL